MGNSIFFKVEDSRTEVKYVEFHTQLNDIKKNYFGQMIEPLYSINNENVYLVYLAKI